MFEVFRLKIYKKSKPHIDLNDYCMISNLKQKINQYKSVY